MRESPVTSDRAVRTFLAIEPSDRVRSPLAEIQSELAPYRSILKQVEPGLMHITVRFLGDVAATRLSRLEASVRETCLHLPPFTLQLGRAGSFPQRGIPRVVWVGLQHDEGYAALQTLFEALQGVLDAAGFGRETRKFTPHLTIARVRERLAQSDGRALATRVRELASREPIHASFDVNHLTVMRSDLSPRGPRYTPLAEVPLRRSG